jgi:iron complex transport system ATP-binding protein
MNILELKNIDLIRDGNTILNNITWSVHENHHWAIIGRNGSGKTMMTNVIAGYEWPTSGSVQLLGKKLGKTDIRELRKHIGWVSNDLQKQVKRQDTVLNVVLSGLFSSVGLYEETTKQQQNKAHEILTQLDMGKDANKQFGILSYGQQRRVLIARSLINEPALLLLDEPCNGLDMRAKQDYLEWLNNLMKQKNGPSIVMITHHIDEIIENIGNVLYLKDGKIFDNGKKQEMLTKEKIEHVLDIEL